MFKGETLMRIVMKIEVMKDITHEIQFFFNPKARRVLSMYTQFVFSKEIGRFRLRIILGFFKILREWMVLWERIIPSRIF